MTAETLNITGRYYRYYPWDAPLGEAEDALAIPLDETVFLLVDVYGQAHGDGFEMPPETSPFYQVSADDPVGQIIRDRIVPAKAAALRAGLRVVYVTNYLSPGLSEGNEWRNMSIRTCGVDVLTEWIPPTPILEHAEIIAPQPGEPVVKKQMYSGFFETNLDSVLRGYGAKYLVAVGFDSRICFGTTVTDAMYRDYRVIALRDAIYTSEFPETKAGGWANFLAVRFIEANVGYTSTVDDFIRACDEIAAARAEPETAASRTSAPRTESAAARTR